jgi:hypothetical protein
VEYYENAYTQVARLLWSSASQVKEIVPHSQLYTSYSGASLSSYASSTVTGDVYGQVYELEQGSLSGGATIAMTTDGYTGHGYVDDFDTDGATVTTAVYADEVGDYQLTLRYNTEPSADQTLSLYVNDEFVQQMTLAESESDWSQCTEAVTLLAGQNTITLRRGPSDSGLAALDSLSLLKIPLLE